MHSKQREQQEERNGGRCRERGPEGKPEVKQELAEGPGQLSEWPVTTLQSRPGVTTWQTGTNQQLQLPWAFWGNQRATDPQKEVQTENEKAFVPWPPGSLCETAPH